MFPKNCWYCAGWDYELSQGKKAILAKQIADQRIVLYRKPDGCVVALEDRCPHRQAPLSLGRKEDDSIRCMYHGLRFAPDGHCVEIPGQDNIPEKACVRPFPVVERDNWIWVWMGDPAKADPSLIPFYVGYEDPKWKMRPAHIQVGTNYRLEIANLMDLSHLTWVHAATFGGTDAYKDVRGNHKVHPRGVNNAFWLRNVPAPTFAQHLFPQGVLFDLHFDVQFSIPCNFIMRFRAFTAGQNTEGPSDGTLVLDTWTCQAVTPRDADSVDYYYSWGPSIETNGPGMADMLHEANVEAFIEDKTILEAQHRNMKERPDAPQVDIRADAGPGKMLWVLDKILKEAAAST